MVKKIVLSLIVCATAVLASEQVTTLKITGMMCPACAKTVKENLSTLKDVKDVKVYLKDGKAEVTNDNGNPAVMCDVVKKAGYGCSVSK